MTTAEILILVLPVAAIQLGLAVLALRDLVRPDRRVKGESKVMWALIIVFLGFLGPVLYLTLGREET